MGSWDSTTYKWFCLGPSFVGRKEASRLGRQIPLLFNYTELILCQELCVGNQKQKHWSCISEVVHLFRANYAFSPWYTDTDILKTTTFYILTLRWPQRQWLTIVYSEPSSHLRQPGSYSYRIIFGSSRSRWAVSSQTGRPWKDTAQKPHRSSTVCYLLTVTSRWQMRTVVTTDGELCDDSEAMEVQMRPAA